MEHKCGGKNNLEMDFEQMCSIFYGESIKRKEGLNSEGLIL